MADNGTLEGSIDEAAQAIERLMSGGGDNNTPAHDDETEELAAAIEAKDATPAVEETPEPTAEAAAPEGNVPSDDKPIVQAQEPAPEPVAKPLPATPKAGTEEQNTAHSQLQQLNQLVPRLQAELAVAFPDVKSIEDLQRLATEDPARVIAYQIAERRVITAVSQQQQLQAQARNEWLVGEKEALARLVPELADPQKGPALGAQLTSYAKELGFTETQIDGASASQVAILHKAMQYDNAQKEAKAKAKAEADAIVAARKKAAEAPPVQKPGVASGTDKKADKLKELEERHAKTGRVDDLARLLEFRAQL